MLDVRNNLTALQKLDKFFTRDDVIQRCLQQVDLAQYDFILEPSAGNGAFLKYLPATTTAIDIEPDSDAVRQFDYFDYQIPSGYHQALVIGNPPFGVNHQLSAQFLQHSFAMGAVQTVAFILPNVYNKHTRQSIIPADWRIKSITPLPRDSFVYQSQIKHVPCSFFVFDKSAGPDLRIDPRQYVETKDFSFSGKNQAYDFFMFGASPKRIVTQPQPNNRGYFIKVKTSLTQVLANIQNIDWQGHSCAEGGVYWLTKAEIVKQYNDYTIQQRRE